MAENRSPETRTDRPSRLGETAPSNRMEAISVPETTSRLLSANRALRRARKATKKRAFRICRSTRARLRRVYWPYWLGAIRTEARRPIFGPRRITYYAIGDAVSGGHVVVRGIPKLFERRVPSPLLVAAEKGIESFELELDLVQKKKIPKLFIFGPPAQQIEAVRLIYCPYWEVLFFPENEKARGDVVHVNAFNGSVRAGQR